ncbi:SusC/RagA family TonB-linked outer membrane protein [Foetidibacter luteolus]|uniref:SusC/RagA family TonB-linked outer membrane protein n=1 Tax=Foetidibacter luteolus TaxID=2608880 RepID=UPI001A989EC4|nr:SusC/RagA family TonB-linked outer membrane protein [Foetidibacter luteolus]
MQLHAFCKTWQGLLMNCACHVIKINGLLTVKPKRFTKTTIITMKLTAILLFAACLQVNAKGIAQSITLTERNVPIESIFKKIEKQTGYLFWYENKLVKQAGNVTVVVKNASLKEVLDECIKDKALSYTIIDKTVVIKQKAIQADYVLYATPPPFAEVTGTVTNEKGEALPGVSVQVKGTSTATATDAAGKYRINVNSADAILVFTFVGYASKEITVRDQVTINISLELRDNSLDEVVVTALDIKKDARKLGYSTATVNTEQITTNRTTNLGNSLQGKVAGLNVSPPAGGPGASSKIRIRGQSSFGGNNSPLIVVNGVPINNSSSSAGTGLNMTSATGGSSDGGDGLQSINQDDIESLTVLKGAAAAALYGFRAKDGVIIITTKSGTKSTGIGVEVNSNFQAEQALDFTDFQYEYGQGEFGKRPTTVAEAQSSGVWSFGEKFDGKPTPQFDGSTQNYVAYPNRIKDFYRTGMNWTNSVAVSGGNEKGHFRLSFANTDAKSIMPNSDYQKKIINLGLTYNLTKQLSVQLNANYSNEYTKNPPQIGIQDMNANTTIYTLANSINTEWLKNYKDANGNEMPLARFTNRNNPYWVTLHRFENIHRDRIFGNASVRYKFTDWLYAQARFGQDYYTRPYDYNRPTGTRSIGAAASGFNGYYYQDVTTFRERNMDFLIGANHSFGNFGIDAIVGGNQMQQVYDNMSTAVTNFYVRDLYTIANGQVKNPLYSYWKKRVNSLYGSVDFSFKNYLYLTVTARNDWFSTLNPTSNSYLYPSVSGSFVFSEALGGKPGWLDFGKVRVAYAQVGGDTDPYANAIYYNVNANPFNGVALGSMTSSISPNANLRPLKVKETELGLEMRMFNGRVNLNASGYIKNTVDEILNVDISNSSGYSQTKVNIGKLQNKGIELLLSVVPVKAPKFNWETSVNGSYNISKVLELANGQTRFDVGAGEFFGNVSHEIGLPLASLRGFDYRRNEKGEILLANGMPQQGSLKTFGSAIPKWVGAWMNTFTIYGFRIFTQVDFKAGHKILSNSNLNFLRHGLHKASLVGREGGVVYDGVNADGSANETSVEAEQFYSSYRGAGLAAPFVYNGAFVRWRSLSIGYDLSRFVKKGFIKGLNVTAIMNNVLMFKKYLDNLDPEAQVSSSDNLQGIETHTLPTTRSYGLNVNVKF